MSSDADHRQTMLFQWLCSAEFIASYFSCKNSSKKEILSTLAKPRTAANSLENKHLRTVTIISIAHMNAIVANYGTLIPTLASQLQSKQTSSVSGRDRSRGNAVSGFEPADIMPMGCLASALLSPCML
jgi:hypothetical protein